MAGLSVESVVDPEETFATERKPRPQFGRGPHRKLFWACISLHVNEDDVFGIFGRNMAEEAR
jgi:hypothetical protein